MASIATLFLLAVGVICIFETVIAQELLGCGGFVKSSASIDFSKIEVKFLSKSTGSVKYKTNCAPKNGYYLVPLYDKGEYVVKLEAPWGWSFDKSEVEVDVNGVDDPCTQQEDINFEFVGFSITGKVVSAGSSSGPSGVKLEVLNYETEETYSGKSEPGGRFEFNEMLPGSYELTASHPLWDVEKGPFHVDIVNDSIVLSRNIQIFGYDVTGQVTDGKSPVESVNFLLRQVDGRNFYCIGSESHRKPPDLVASESVCATTSDSTGKFRFPSVAPGNYLLRAQFMKSELRFGISPREIPVTVTQGSVAVEEHFKVEGFEVKGRVKTSEKVGHVEL